MSNASLPQSNQSSTQNQGRPRNFGTNPQYQALIQLGGNFNPLAREFCRITKFLNPLSVKIFIFLMCKQEIPSLRDIGKEICADKKTIMKAIDELIHYGFFIREGSKRGARMLWNPKREDWGKTIVMVEKKDHKKEAKKTSYGGKKGPVMVEKKDHNGVVMVPQTDQSAAPSLLLKEELKILLKKEDEKEEAPAPLGGPGLQEKEEQNPEQRELNLMTMVLGGVDDDTRRQATREMILALEKAEGMVSVRSNKFSIGRGLANIGGA